MSKSIHLTLDQALDDIVALCRPKSDGTNPDIASKNDTQSSNVAKLSKDQLSSQNYDQVVDAAKLLVEKVQILNTEYVPRVKESAGKLKAIECELKTTKDKLDEVNLDY
ncbi:hypothetical protein H4219_005597 [Mycoemilia scoparia]|uniref:Uncharacterized protein n=1 Tax=Mycoemilia scoparia TaxID=417184 RepID=A0A9W8DPS4_9FUNG|nr:hypothetical protein H4219_005597 [Mycoemilia scoparia]